MDFGSALAALKGGMAVTREGWNASGQFVYLVPEDVYPARTPLAKSVWGDDGLVPYRAYLALKTAQGDVATWQPSCSDVLANDWALA